MRFGFILPNTLSPVSNAHAIRTTAKLAEDVGFDSLWVSDHILMPEEHARYGQGTEALMTLAYAAGITERIGFGLSVLILPMRDPILAAKQIASLQHLSGRSVIAGLGVGWAEQEFRFLNADFHQRGRLMDEYIEIMRKLWTEETPEHSGTYTFANARFAPMPQPVPPVWIGGASEAALRRAATLGDGYQPTAAFGKVEDFARLIARLRELSEGRSLTISLSTRVNMDDGASAVIDHFNQLREVGLAYPVLRFQHETLDDLTQQLEAFGRDVIPALQSA